MIISSPPFSIKTFGQSMYPLLKDEDIVYIGKTNFAKIKFNDIICVKKNQKIFTHRVIYKTDKYLITKGDKNFNSDGKIYPKNIIGLVTKIKRGKQVININDLYLFQSTFYFQEIIKVKKAFNEISVDFVFLKGLPLYLYFEKFHPKRIYADCDILISRSDFNKAEKKLESLGYKKQTPSGLKKDTLSNFNEVTFVKFVNGFPVVFDIHLEVSFLIHKMSEINALYPHQFVRNLSDLFLKEKTTIVIKNETFPILARENLFVYLCLHLFNHNFKGAYRYQFIIKIIDSNLNYQKITALILKFKLQNFIYPGLVLLKKYFKSSIPDNFTLSVRPNNKITMFIQKQLGETDIFQDLDLVGSAKHFRLLFNLSPSPFILKLLIFFKPGVIQRTGQTVLRKIKPQFSSF